MYTHTHTPTELKGTHYGFTIRPGTVSRKSNEGFSMKNIFILVNLIQVCLCVYAVYIIYIYIHYSFQASIQNVSHNSSELKTNLDSDKVPLDRGTGY